MTQEIDITVLIDEMRDKAEGVKYLAVLQAEDFLVRRPRF
jgi:hypothetical protein